MDLQPGSFVRLRSRNGSSQPNDTYQVVSVDEFSDSCWVRRWPLPRRGSPVFSVPLQDLTDAGTEPGTGRRRTALAA